MVVVMFGNTGSHVAASNLLACDSLIREVFYPDTESIYSRAYAHDSVAVDNCHTSLFGEVYYEYYPEGSLRIIGYQGWFGAGGTSVGLHKHYDEQGNLLRTEDFIYPTGLHEHYDDNNEYLSYVVLTDYYGNGRPKWRKVYQNYIYYADTDHPDFDEDYRRRLGRWFYYDEWGNITDVEDYSYLDECSGLNHPLQ